ncbi:fimbria/pilus outer membrane usher protein [Ralstonia sp. 24A2]|uniref:fimbria/pilus outer membrane usher protein n=1 Tax=Ralstonia sp. 24A2 TaxID=3447364 RepID=UPI003F69D17A
MRPSTDRFRAMNPRHRRPLQPAYLSRLIAALVAGVLPGVALASTAVEFDPRLIYGESASNTNWSRFASNDTVAGTYGADIRINGTFVMRRDIDVQITDDGRTQVCLDPALFDQVGLDAKRVAASGKSLRPLPTEVFCDDLSNYVPDVTVNFDAGEQVLDISIPQAYLARDPRGWVSPELRDNGINAARLNYSVNHQLQSSSGYATRNTTSALLNTGVNIGAWRFRHDGYFAYDSQTGGSYRAGRTLVQRDLPGMDAQLTLGEASTTGDLFDGVNYRGVSVSTDARMLPDSQNGYAPTVRGVAQSNARVVIRQRGNVIYETMVAPGPFEISDLYGTASSGDLNVEVIEADGRVQRFVVPFAAVPQLLRNGQQRYSMTVGQLRDPGLPNSTQFVEATLRRGVSDQVTLFGGVTASNGYGAVLVGGALNTTIGAFSGDVTVARTQLPGELPGFGSNMSGQSYRLTYSKDLPATNTNITVAAYRYSTQGYLSLTDAARVRGDLREGFSGQDVARQRGRLDLTVNQRLGEKGGSLFVNASSADYWNRGQRATSFSVGYSNTWKSVTYSISAQRTMERSLYGNEASRQTNSINLSLSIPLGKAGDAPNLSTSMDRDSDGRQNARVGVSGSFGELRQGNYNVSANHGSDAGARFNGDVNYTTSVANLSAGISSSQGSQQLSLSASGGVVVHGDGVAFSQQMGDTVGIVHVPDAPGAGVGNGIGVKTDARGYAVVPYLSPYRRNEVTIDPKGLPLDVELKSASVTTVPTAGAVVRVVVPTSSGRTALIEAVRPDGQPLPFGVDVTNEAGEVIGVVGQASRLWVRGVEERGRLFVRWGEEATQQCAVNYNLAGVASGDMVVSQCSAD